MFMKCVLCGNCNTNTKDTRPELIYHKFPCNPNSRKKWLKVCGIDQVNNWRRVCSDHFLKEHYRPGNKQYLCKNAVPQTFARSSNGNGFLYNSTTQSNGMQVDDNTFLPIEQNRPREEQYFENAVVNNLVPPKPSSKQIILTTTNDDMPRIQTERFKGQIPAGQLIANGNIQTVIKSDEEPVTTTTEDFEPHCCPIPGRITNTDGVFRDEGFIYKISKMVEFPSLFWSSDYVKRRNETNFYQRDRTETFIAKKVSFYNSFEPIITIYEQKYKFNVPILTKNELKILLELINRFEKCPCVNEKCRDYLEESYLELLNYLLTRNKMPTQREIISCISKTLKEPPGIINTMKQHH